eukprot:5216-Heterococcus_DN1.PRE.1
MRSPPVCSASLTKRTKIDRSFASTCCKQPASALSFFAAVMVVQSALSSALNIPHKHTTICLRDCNKDQNSQVLVPVGIEDDRGTAGLHQGACRQ